MTEIHLNLNNFCDFEVLLSLFPLDKHFEFSSKKVFRRKDFIVCKCGSEMVHNGFDFVRKKGFGKSKVGKQICPNCKSQHHEDKGFWKNLLSEWEKTITSFIIELRDSNVSWKAISSLMRFIMPFSKDKARYLFNEEIEQFEYEQDNYVFVNYDEQHPKEGRTQKYRLTLLNYQTKTPIADSLFDNKDESTIEAFLRKNLDTEKKLIVIVDCDRRYPQIFKKIWGENLVIQKCLLHLNKMIVADFGKKLSLQEEYNKYLLLNIFYNRKKELKFLEKLLKKQSKKILVDNKEWLKKAKQKFYDYLRDLENERRREGRNLTQRSLKEAQKNFELLFQQKMLFPQKIRERLEMIKKNWEYFTAFYNIKGCPATNNAIENYYSTSLKTHRKKALRTEKGILNHMKIAALKRTKGFQKPDKTLITIYGLLKMVST